METTQSTAAIILAAGGSSRMGAGRHKLLLPLGERPVIVHVVAAALASQARPVVVVLGRQAEEVQTAITTYSDISEIIFVANPDYAQGMSTSLRLALTTLQGLKEQAIDGAVILLGDQPLMTPQIIHRLLAERARTQMAIIASQYAGERGHPMLFAATLFPELQEISGDEGGRSVVARHKHEIAVVEQGNLQADYDVDTWEAYQEVVALWQQHHEQ